MSPRSALTVLVGAGAVLGTGLWALAPLTDPAGLSAPTEGIGLDAAPPAPDAPVALDLTAFGAPLWLAPPPPPPKPAPKPPAPPPPPLRLQLVGIVVEAGGAKAVLYDPDTDVLHIVAAGAAVGTCAVETVTASAVTLRDGAGVRTLALRDDAPEGTAP
jgi:hypothetical protein